MEELRDPRVIATLVAAAASISVATLTFAYKILGEVRERASRRRACLMMIRNEVFINRELASVVAENTRVFGIRFSESVWASSDTSVIYSRGVPASLFLEFYCKVATFNILNERADRIRDYAEYPDKRERLAIEQVEMVVLAQDIGSKAEALLNAVPI